MVDVRTGGNVKFRPITRLKFQMSTLVTSQLFFASQRLLNSIFGTLELPSFNLFLFYLTSVGFSM